MPRADVTQTQRGEPLGNREGHRQTVAAEERAVVLPRHLHHIAGVEERKGPAVFVSTSRPFVALRIGFEVEGDLVAAGVVVADEDPDIDVALQILP